MGFYGLFMSSCQPATVHFRLLGQSCFYQRAIEDTSLPIPGETRPALRDHRCLGTKVPFVLLVSKSRDHDFLSCMKSTLVGWPDKEGHVSESRQGGKLS